MDKELNDDSENELKEDQSFKSLEDFFAKEINTVFTPQELMILSSSLNYVGQLLVLFKQHTNIAVFDVKEFTAKHPEYAYIDFNDMANLDPDIRNDIKNTFSNDGKKGEEFSKGDILLNSMFSIIASMVEKFYELYMKEYGTCVPEETGEFFTMLDNCLQSPIVILKEFFIKNS
jgi:hypothetical protein